MLPTRIGVRNDISYGMYVYGFPVQHALILLGFATGSALGFWVTATLLTAPLAWASWLLVERPAMRLRNVGRSRLVADMALCNEPTGHLAAETE